MYVSSPTSTITSTMNVVAMALRSEEARESRESMERGAAMTRRAPARPKRGGEHLDVEERERKGGG